MRRKVEAWKAINGALVQANSDFMSKLFALLKEKSEKQEELKVKLEKNEGTEDENAEYIFLGGYIQCLKDILGAKKNGEEG